MLNAKQGICILCQKHLSLGLCREPDLWSDLGLAKRKATLNSKTLETNISTVILLVIAIIIRYSVITTYIYICMYVYIYISSCMCVCIYIYIA